MRRSIGFAGRRYHRKESIRFMIILYCFWAKLGRGFSEVVFVGSVVGVYGVEEWWGGGMMVVCIF